MPDAGYLRRRRSAHFARGGTAARGHRLRPVRLCRLRGRQPRLLQHQLQVPAADRRRDEGQARRVTRAATNQKARGRIRMHMPMTARRGTLLAAAVVAIMGLGTAAQAQDAGDYPNRPVQLIIGYGAGTIGDVSMRIVAQKLTDQLGKPFVVENRPGAAGVFAAKAATMAAPDGYTLLLTGNSYAINTTWFKSVPYNVLKDFAP